MRQRALPLVNSLTSRPLPSAAAAIGETKTMLSHRRNRSQSAEKTNSGGSSTSSSWEITSSPQPDSAKHLHSFHYPNGYQNHRRKHVALQNVHLFYRTPLHVSDADYRAFIGLTKTPASAPISRQCCLSVCVGFSWIAVGFFLLIYVLLRFQPLYIPHALSHHYIQRNGKLVKVSDVGSSPLATVALHTMFAYLAVALICGYYANPNKWRQQKYQDIPEATLPITARANTGPIDLYEDSICERASAGFKKWMLVKGYRRARRKQVETKTV
ncbi:hypothetical protein MPSEU_000078900 [Mayamaea pseudoterrestris]|nr:hypothetical protein MPSEU_000078900 [Mayamaea pseudoterrestris]